jgi:Cell Wall Hydrolase
MSREAVATPLPGEATMWTASGLVDMRWRLGIAVAFVVALAMLLHWFAPARAPDPISIDLAAARHGPLPVSNGSTTPTLPDPASLMPLPAEEARLSNAAVTAVAIVEMPPPDRVATPFVLEGLPPDSQDRARDCLAAAAWYEAGDDPSGERAVVQVVLNRARHPAFAASVCGVVFQGSDRRTGCQFTFTCDGSLDARHPAAAVWARARAIAGAALAGAVDARVGWATHYHADYVVPRWRDQMDKLATVGVHAFYRWRGGWGRHAAFRRVPGEFGAEPHENALASLSLAHAAGSSLGQLQFARLDEGDLGDDAVAGGVRTELFAPHRNGNADMAAGRTPADIAHDAPTRKDLIASDADHIGLLLDPAMPPGRYAIAALEACGHRPRCMVTGRRRGQEGSALAFLYRRDRGGSGEGAWWDCRLTPRLDAAQCLPAAAARERLLAW